MIKDWILLIVSIAITLLVALGVIRWFAPQLLGLSADMQLVKIDKKVPPFYKNIFRVEDYKSQKFSCLLIIHRLKKSQQLIFTYIFSKYLPKK